MPGTLIMPVTQPPLDAAIANVAVEYDPQGLVRLRFNQTQAPAKNASHKPKYPYIQAFIDRLTAYLQGHPVAFDDIPMNLTAFSTPFRQAVWTQTQLIPYGTVISYSQLARNTANSPSYARAVGGALNANPLPIVIPCHRILASNGSLGGFGAGLDIKKALLALEQSLP